MTPVSIKQARERDVRVAIITGRGFRDPGPKLVPSLVLRTLALLAIMLCAGSSVWAQQPTVTFSGRVTDQSTAEGIAEVAIVAQGNQTGTRVAVTDVQGNYSLPLGPNTNIKLRAYKTGFVFNPAFFGISSVGGQPITGTRTVDFSGDGSPILIFGQAPIVLTEDESLRALALEAMFETRDPFPVVNDNYSGDDKRTRLRLFLVDLDLFSGETLSIISVQALDAQQRNSIFPVEDRRKVPGVPWLVQLTVLLPSDLTAPNDLVLSVSLRGQTSNSVNLRIR